MALVDLIGLNKAPIEDVNVGENIKSGLQAGIGLATAKEQVEATKMKVTEQKMELQTKQATAMMNRTKAAMFAQSPAAFDSIMKANENYANSIGLPYNGEALRAAYKDPNLRLAAQKEINTVMQGGISRNPQAIIDFFGSDSPAIFEHLQNASYANAQNKQKMDQQTKIEQMGNASAERIAALGVDKIDKREDIVLAKEKRAEAKQLDNDFANVESALKDIDDAEAALKAYSKKTTAGTGPLATGFGLKKYGSEETERLDAKLKKLSLDSMVKMFSGMSKAVDTGAERRAFEATQSGISLDDKTNLDILAKQRQALLATKKKILNAKKGIGAIEASGQAAADPSPSPKEPPDKAKAQAALERARAAQAGK